MVEWGKRALSLYVKRGQSGLSPATNEHVSGRVWRVASSNGSVSLSSAGKGDAPRPAARRPQAVSARSLSRGQPTVDSNGSGVMHLCNHVPLGCQLNVRDLHARGRQRGQENQGRLVRSQMRHCATRLLHRPEGALNLRVTHGPSESLPTATCAAGRRLRTLSSHASVWEQR